MLSQLDPGTMLWFVHCEWIYSYCMDTFLEFLLFSNDLTFHLLRTVINLGSLTFWAEMWHCLFGKIFWYLLVESAF